MKNIISAYRSIVVGAVCGLLMICAWSMRTSMLTQPAWALGQVCFLAMMAGVIIGGLSSYQGGGLEQSVKFGSKGAIISVVVASACFALMLRTLPGELAALRGLLIPLVIVLPAILVGTIGATLGALIFRRSENNESPPQYKPRFFGITYWGVILVSMVIAAFCPLYPTPYPPAEKRAYTDPFHFSPPEAMATAPAAAWELETQRVIGNFDINRGLDISKDERFVAGVSGGDIVVYDLESERMQRISPRHFSVGNLAFNPTGDRLLLVSGSEPRRIAVVELTTQRVTLLPQPKKHAVPAGRVVWWREEELIFNNDGKAFLSLNLDSLEIDPSILFPTEREEIRLIHFKGLPRNERWAIGRTHMVTSAELPETEGNNDWVPTGKTVLSFSDLQHPMERCLSEVDVTPDDWIIGAKNGSRILRLRNGEATAFYFRIRKVPPLRWNISMPHGPEKLIPVDAAKYACELGELFLVMYAPMTNPLTGKTIGPDRNQPKAVMRFVKWDGLEAEICMSQDFQPFTQGDVFADVYRTVRRASPLLLKFEGPHRWWMVAPQPPANSTDLAKFPTQEELKKRWSAANERIVEDEKRTSAEAARLAAEKQAGKPPIVLIKPEVMPNQHEFDSNHEKLQEPQSVANKLTPTEQEITNFVVQHHQKATRGEITEMVEDYAQQVDHFNNGIVDRLFIYDDEFKYHQKMEKLTEEIDGLVNVREIRNGVFEARYVMSNFWRRLDGKSGRSRNEITLDVVKQRGVWQITKHRSVPIK